MRDGEDYNKNGYIERERERERERELNDDSDYVQLTHGVAPQQSAAAARVKCSLSE